MTELIRAMAVLQATFEKYAGKDGDNATLSKAELVELLQKEFPVVDPTKKDEVDKFFNMLDNDKDGLVDFTEYVTFITALCVICKFK